MPSLAKVRSAARTCRNCDLWKSATQSVFGEGPARAPVMLVGEQPGNDEDLAGHPFVGPAGKLLDRALEDAGIDRRQVYVTNVVSTSSGSRAASAGSIRNRDRVRSPRADRGSTTSWRS